ncbi:hypothetical protein ACIPLC_20755 [Kitasatospora sp. NPDC086801]|uniref:hypothetical protein n=1 Tax=Kitasatospora sp. NPDC086801 TaxID=3364066 RepID=UPI00382048EA
MRHLIAVALRAVLRLVLPARGQHRAVSAEPKPIPAAVAAPVITRRADYEAPFVSALVRPYVDRNAWLAELDAMQREFEEREQQRARRDALRAVVMGEPDPGYTFPGAHTLAGAVA